MTFTRPILHSSFVQQFAKQPVRWAFGALSELTFARTYSRELPDNSKEQYYQTIQRVVNGVYQMKHEHMQEQRLPIDWEKDMLDAKQMYQRMFEFKFLPGGRSLWLMGTTLTTNPDKSKRLYSGLNNCGFVTTAYIDEEFSKPFKFAMDMLMLGCGIGSDMRGVNKLDIHRPCVETKRIMIIEDSRQGWVDSLGMLIDSYFKPDQAAVEFDYSELRPKGQPIRGFGGVSSGPGPLMELHQGVRETLEKNVDKPITTTTIANIINMTGRAVIAGNIRRSALILLGDDQDEEFLHLKNWEKHPERSGFAWTSNNSVFYDAEMDFDSVAESILKFGEPGIINLENMRNFGRLNGEVNESDKRVMGCNPCAEQQLEHFELCNLVETFPANAVDWTDYQRTLELAFEYGKYVSLGMTHWPETNAVLGRNRRIGLSMSGIADFIETRGMPLFEDWCKKAYVHIKNTDVKISEELCVRESVRVTSIKPSGTVSLLAGSTAGIHYSQAEYYVRRVRLAKNHELVPLLEKAGIPIEPSVTDMEHTVVASFPIHSKNHKRFVKDLSLYDQMSLAAMIQRNYADNMVSCTITFSQEKETVESISDALQHFVGQLKCVSMLPLLDSGSSVYPQMPLEELSKEQYEAMAGAIQPLDLAEFYKGQRKTKVQDSGRKSPYELKRAEPASEDPVYFLDVPESERYCSGDSCTVAS